MRDRRRKKRRTNTEEQCGVFGAQVRSPCGGRLAGAYIYGSPVSDDDGYTRGGVGARTDLVEHK